MDNGRIVEQGTHAVLLDAGGAYARLYAAQFESFDAHRPGRRPDDANTEDTMVLALPWLGPPVKPHPFPPGSTGHADGSLTRPQ
jgi:hypothetical protein